MIALCTLIAGVGCGGGTSDGDDGSDLGALENGARASRHDLTQYSMVVGIAAKGEGAHTMRRSIAAAGARRDGDTVYAGLAPRELGLSGAEAADEIFGLACDAEEDNHRPVCFVQLVVKSDAVKESPAGLLEITVSGRLAEAMRTALPRADQDDGTGSGKSSAGPIECTKTSSAGGASCTMALPGEATRLDAFPHYSSEVADKIVDALFASAR